MQKFARKVAFIGKCVLFCAFVPIAVVLAFPSFLAGLVMWWRFYRTWDQREYWRGLSAAAAFGSVVYVVWLTLANPLPWLLYHLWAQGGHTWLLLWLFHLWLAPLCGVVLTGLYPGKGRGKLVAPKVPAAGEIERGEQDLEATAFVTIERIAASLPGSATGLSSSTPTIATAPTTTIAVPGVAYQASYEALGTYEGGELEDLVQGGEVCLPPDLLELHGVLIGEPKFGKSTTLLRLAAIARVYGRKVIYLDLKGSKKTAALFLAAMSQLGVQRVQLFPLDAYNGWRGDPQSLFNRLMEQIDPASHPFYRSGVGSTLVSLAVKAPGGPPRNSYEFLERLDVDWLTTAYAADAQALREIGNTAPYVGGLAVVFAGFFRGIAGGLDGSWAIDDVDACYIGINGVDHKEEAATFGRFILEDAANYATSRKDPNEQVLFIVDEFGVLRSTNATALFESVREAGMSVWAAGQSYQSLGKERDSVLAASAVKVLHRCGNPEPLVRYAGERERFSFSRMVGGAADEEEELLHPAANRPGDDGGQQTIMRPQKELTIPIEDVQQLVVGRIALISGGRGGYVQVHPLALPHAVVQAASRYIVSRPRYQPLSPPQVPVAATSQQPSPGGQQVAGRQQRGKPAQAASQGAGSAVKKRRQAPAGPVQKSTLVGPPAQASRKRSLPQVQAGQGNAPGPSQQQVPVDDEDLDFFR